MKNFNLTKIYPHLIALVIFIGLGYAYFPQVFEGKVLNQSDISSWLGSAQESFEFRKATGEEPLWTGAMFGGMPTNMITIQYKGNYVEPLQSYFYILDKPAGWFIVSMVGFYLLMLCLGVNSWLAVVGAIAFTFCSYNMEIIQVGHNNKMTAIAYMPWVLASLVFLFRKNAPLGAAFFGIMLALEILSRHPQITFYLGIIVLFYVIAEFITAIRKKLLPHFMKASLFLLLGTTLGVCTNVNSLWPTWEYTTYTMRGGSELRTDDKNAPEKGLHKDYATDWSYGIEETPNLMIPNFNGGSSAGALDKDSEIYKILKGQGAENADQIIKQMPLYWGPQPFTAGPMYLGAISIFLFALGLVLVKGPLKWWIAATSLLALFLGWGKHMMWFTELFFDYVPLYNKFRTVSMMLVVLQITVPLLGLYAVNQILKFEYTKEKLLRAFKIALGVTAGFCLLVLVIPGIAGSFTSPGDANYPAWLADNLPIDRKSLLRADAMRSLVFILLAAATLWFAFIKKLQVKPAMLILGVLIVADMWVVGKRYLNDDHFVSEKEFSNQFQMRPVDKEILKDEDPNYRVLDLTVNTFNDSHVSYHHKTIGGYSAAKLQRYQDMIEYHIMPEMQLFVKGIQTAKSEAEIDSALSKLSVLNMLNTKYMVINPNGAPVFNDAALGNAWFVKDYTLVNSANEEILALKVVNPAENAIIGADFIDQVKNKTFHTDSTAVLALQSYAPNKLEYKYSAPTEQLAVFSEIYYPVGWKAFIDGVETPYFRADYILRAMVLPAGEHTVVFKYAPESYFKGADISRVASGMLILLLLGALGYSIWVNRKKFVKE